MMKKKASPLVTKVYTEGASFLAAKYTPFEAAVVSSMPPPAIWQSWGRGHRAGGEAHRGREPEEGLRQKGSLPQVSG